MTRDLRESLASRARLVRRASKDPRVSLVPRVRPGHRVPQDLMELRVRLDPPALRAIRARPGSREPPALKEPLVRQVLRAIKVVRE